MARARSTHEYCSANLTPVFMDVMCAMSKDKNEHPQGKLHGVFKAAIKLTRQIAWDVQGGNKTDWLHIL